MVDAPVQHATPRNSADGSFKEKIIRKKKRDMENHVENRFQKGIISDATQ